MIEIRDVRQNANEYFRRWFSDDNFDLFVWYNPEETIYGFELTYDKAGCGKAIRWFVDSGFSHYRVDDGDQSSFSFDIPILRLITEGGSEMAQVLSRFEASDEEMPIHITMLVQSKLREYGRLDS